MRKISRGRQRKILSLPEHAEIVNYPGLLHLRRGDSREIAPFAAEFVWHPLRISLQFTRYRCGEVILQLLSQVGPVCRSDCKSYPVIAPRQHTRDHPDKSLRRIVEMQQHALYLVAGCAG